MADPSFRARADLAASWDVAQKAAAFRRRKCMKITEITILRRSRRRKRSRRGRPSCVIFTHQEAAIKYDLKIHVFLRYAMYRHSRRASITGMARRKLSPAASPPQPPRRPFPAREDEGCAIMAGQDTNRPVPLMIFAIAMSLPGAVLAQDEITIRADTTAQRFATTPGAVSLIDRREAVGQAAPTLADTLSGVPGVVVQQFFGGNDQPRIQIRGSGLQQNPSERGLLVMQDGMPVNRADGAYVVGLAAPGQAESVEVFRGAAAQPDRRECAGRGDQLRLALGRVGAGDAVVLRRGQLRAGRGRGQLRHRRRAGRCAAAFRTFAKGPLARL
ncbi:Plug domain-containing protein [uncultured Paracoccus sp.]|uniref:Plug domain-containing protein n=1 Tax=uncultured Paracoccus sp. TaxID=189685 RepID=UPI0025F80EA9|nr:Plug domain-containing protein [uncultured Paracoccus sp.]